MRNKPALYSILRDSVWRIAVTTFISVLAVPALAGRYELVQGKGVKVCEAYERSLNSLGKTWPMNCVREVYPGLGLLKPDWEVLDAPSRFSLIQKVDEVLEPSAYDPVSEGYLADLRTRAERQAIRLEVAEVDIDNDGLAEPILKCDFGPCAPPGTKGWWATPILVLNQRQDAVDLGKTRPLFQNDSTNAEYDPAGGWRYAQYDVFVYEGRTYFDRWSDFRSETSILKLFLTEAGATREICRYHWK
jgi:hypothetical protein